MEKRGSCGPGAECEEIQQGGGSHRRRTRADAIQSIRCVIEPAKVLSQLLGLIWREWMYALVGDMSAIA